MLGDSNGSVVIVGERAVLHPQASALRAAAMFVAKATGSAYDEIPSGANAIGLAQVGVVPRESGLDARAMLREPRKGYVLYGCEPPEDFGDGALALEALSAAQSVVAFSSYVSEPLKRVASVILPIGLVPEIDATLVNVDGTMQTSGAGDEAARRCAARLEGAACARRRAFARRFRFHRDRRSARRDHQELGFHARVREVWPGVRCRASRTWPPARRCERIATTAIYRADAVLRRTPALQAHPLTRGALATLNPEDALALGLGHGAKARVAGVDVAVEISRNVPRGAVWIEAGYAETATLPPYGAAVDIARASA